MASNVEDGATDLSDTDRLRNASQADATDPLDIVEMNEAYEQDANGEYSFSGTLIVYRAPNGDLHHAKYPSRIVPSVTIRAEQLTQDRTIPVADFCPPWDATLSRAPTPSPVDCYIKTPRLISYDRCSDDGEIAAAVLHEAFVCEDLLRCPHPNVATYLGCQVSAEGRITGLCFQRYSHTLMQHANPSSLMKRTLRAKRMHDDETYRRVLEDAEKGVRHLHSLGWIHNDINPSNVMLDGKMNGVIIDFGSCRKPGSSLEAVGRTYEWYNEAVDTAQPSNDLDAVEEMRIWLGSDCTKPFLFEQ